MISVGLAIRGCHHRRVGLASVKAAHDVRRGPDGGGLGIGAWRGQSSRRRSQRHHRPAGTTGPCRHWPPIRPRRPVPGCPDTATAASCTASGAARRSGAPRRWPCSRRRTPFVDVSLADRPPRTMSWPGDPAVTTSRLSGPTHVPGQQARFGGGQAGLRLRCLRVHGCRGVGGSPAMTGCAVCTSSEQGVDGHNYHGQRGGSGTPATRVNHAADATLGRNF